jgi:hypothetical protein
VCMDRHRSPQHVQRVLGIVILSPDTGTQADESGRAQTRPDPLVSQLPADALNGSSPLEGLLLLRIRASTRPARMRCHQRCHSTSAGDGARDPRRLPARLDVRRCGHLDCDRFVELRGIDT